MGCGASSPHPVGVERNNHAGGRAHPHHSTAAGSMNRSPLPLPPSQPVSAPVPYRYGTSITKQQLDALRSGFWSTRVEGNVNMW